MYIFLIPAASFSFLFLGGGFDKNGVRLIRKGKVRISEGLVHSHCMMMPFSYIVYFGREGEGN